MSVITLCGLAGAGARVLGPIITERLNADYLDRIFLSNVAKDLGTTVSALHSREERAPTRSQRWFGVVQRILERSAVSGTGGDPYFGPGVAAFLTEEYEDIPGTSIHSDHNLQDEDYISSIQSTMRDIASEGNVVFVGRGGHVILKDMPDVLRVGVVAHYEDRIATVMRRESLSEEDAIGTIRGRDEARGHYFRKFFELDDPDRADLFHFTVNTSEMNEEYCIKLIVEGLDALKKGELS